MPKALIYHSTCLIVVEITYSPKIFLFFFGFLRFFYLSSSQMAINFIFKIDKWNDQNLNPTPYIYNAMSLAPCQLCLAHGTSPLSFILVETKQVLLFMYIRFFRSHKIRCLWW
jgi:hypothetical protein